MANAYQILSQSNPSAATLTDSYTVPASTEAVVSVINVANRSSTATSFRISIAKAGAADSNEQYIYYDIAIAGGDTFQSVSGFGLETTDVVRVYATLATLSFTFSGVEITA